MAKVEINMRNNPKFEVYYQQENLRDIIKSLNMDRLMVLADIAEAKLTNKKVCIFDKLSLHACDAAIAEVKENLYTTLN